MKRDSRQKRMWRNFAVISKPLTAGGTFADRAVWLITNEEILAYFAGEITIDQCIDRIQNRASIWISEQS